jgi:signal peptidase II
LRAQGRATAWRAVCLVAAFGVYVADQATKVWAVRRLMTGGEVRVIDGLLHFGYAENPGIAFGQFQGGGELGRWALSALAAVAAVGVLVYFFRASGVGRRTLAACALLLSGVAGNLTDRVRLGYVVDFIELHLGAFQWPTFNIADAAICVGAGLLALDIIRDGKKGEGEERRGGRGEEETAAQRG